MSDSEQERDDIVDSDEDEDFADRGEEDEEQDDEEEEEEDEDEGEADDLPAKSTKKKRKTTTKSSSRKRVKNFFLDEAEVAGEDDEEEEEDEEDGYYDEKYGREAAEAAQAAREIDMRRRNAANYLQEKSVTEIVEDVTARYRRQHRPMFADGAGEYDMAPEVTQQSLLPRSTDPSLWVVQCKPGSEQLVVLSLMRKALDFKENRRIELGIKSVFSTATKGYIYIEASHEASAREAINGLNLIRHFTMKKLPLDQMTAVLTIRQTRKPIVIGQWARYKRGPYKGDLCKILDIIEGGDRVVVQVVPRLDYSKLKIPGARALATTLKEKYPQKFFNALECAQNGGAVERVRYPGLMQESVDYFEGNHFRQGFLLKDVRPDTTLTWEKIQPTLAELQQFRERKDQEDHDDGDDDTPQAATNLLDQLAQITDPSAVSESKPERFQPGDMVQVISGDLMNLIGRIESIDEVTGAVTIEPRSAAFQGTVQVAADQLIKHIEVGSHIKVLGGVYAGNTGTVVAIEELEGDYICVVLTDGLKTELKVNIRDVVETSEVTAGLSNLAGYELYDLVVLGQSETAVVIGVGAEHLRVITHQSVEKQIRPQELRGKRNLQSLRATAMDNVQNTLQEGDIVTVVKGNFAKKTGTIKHINKGTLWLHSNSHHKNAGIFVVRSRSCMLSGTRARAAITNMRSGSGMRQAGGGVGGPGARQSNEFKNTTVQITKGPYKGLYGHVVDANDTHLRVELHSKLKKVMIEIDKVQKIGDKQGAFGGQTMRPAGAVAYPMGIPDTPAMIAETPRHVPDTPMHGLETPSHDAMPYTPSRPTTPGHDSIWRPTARPVVSNPTGVTDDYGGFRPSSDQAFLPIPSSYGSTGTGYQSGYTARAYSHSPYGDGSSIYTPSYGEGYSPNPTPMAQVSADIAPSEWPKDVVLVFKSGPEVGSEVNLRENLGDIMEVQMPNGRFERVAARELGPANPQRKDKVIVLSGSYKGLTGTLKRFGGDAGGDDSEAYVKPLDGSDAVLIPKLCLGKLAA